MITVIFDGIPYQVKEGRNLLEAALDSGLNLPYFCWHPAMRSIGACRQCAVRVFKDADDPVGRIQMGCMTDARDGIRANIEDREAIEFRRAVIEWLMINHPHDCPVCDEGGECHLQDMTAMTGHVYRRYRGKKRTFDNQDLGPFVNHEMNRCIQCYRCARFYRDLAGGRDLNVFGCHDNVYFGRDQSGVLESEFSGNLVEVCPTGVFTDKTLARHYTRKWDLQTAPSICPHCGLGCNIIPGERYKTLRRVCNRYNGEVNGYFLCDRGRFGYEFVNQPQRIVNAFSRERGKSSLSEGLQRATELLHGANRVLGIGSGRASLEANYALRELVGEGNFSPGIPDGIHHAVDQAIAVFREGPARTPSLREIESADAVLLLAVDPTNEAPMLDFSIRQGLNRVRLRAADELKIPHWDDAAIRTAGQGMRGTLDVLASAPVKLEEIAREVVHADPVELLDLAARVVESVKRQGAGEEAVDRIAAALLTAEQPLVVVGAASEAPMVRAGAEIARAVQTATKKACWLTVVSPGCNAFGAALIGGRAVSEILGEIEAGRADALVVLENDLYEIADTARVNRALSLLSALVVLDCVESPTTNAADVVLPASAYAESSGTYVSNEGRAQRFFQVFVPEGEQQESWSLLGRIAHALKPGRAPWRVYEDVTRELSKKIPALAGAIDAAPPADWRIAQMKIARETKRFSGRTAIDANRTVNEPRPPADPATPFAFTMEGFHGDPPSALIPRFWAPGWNSVQSVTRFQEEVLGPLRGGNPGVRLLDPTGAVSKAVPGSSPPPLAEGEFRLVPVWRIFGSEALSRIAPGIGEVIPEPMIGLNPDDAVAIDVKDGYLVEFAVGGEMRRLPVKLIAALPRRVATVPVGYPETRGFVSLSRGMVRRAE